MWGRPRPSDQSSEARQFLASTSVPTRSLTLASSIPTSPCISPSKKIRTAPSTFVTRSKAISTHPSLESATPNISASSRRSRSTGSCCSIAKWRVALENLYKQGKVVGGVYFGLGQEACSCASAYALDKDDWFAPMIRNQGSLLVRGFRAADTMMQYMAKADSPTKGRDGTSHFGDIEKRNMVSPISMLGDLIPVLSGVALGARLQGRNIAVMTYIGDGGQSTGVTYEGINFAAVQNLGLFSSSRSICGPTRRHRKCSTAAKISRSAPSDTGSPA